MTSKEYIQKFIIYQAKVLQAKNAYMASLTTLTVGLEVMGGFFDKKPLKSPKQSKYRFRMATDKLLGGRYSIINKDDYLYEVLRNQLLHSLLPGRALIFDNIEKEKHLFQEGKAILFSPEVFLADIEKASIKLEMLISDGKAYEKRIPDNSHELIAWLG